MKLVTHTYRVVNSIIHLVKKRNILSITLASIFFTILFAIPMFFTVMYYLIIKDIELNARMWFDSAIYSIGFGSIIGIFGFAVLLLEYFYRKITGNYENGKGPNNGQA